MDKELTVPKWVLIVWPKTPQMPQKFQPKMCAQAQKFKIFEKKTSLCLFFDRVGLLEISNGDTANYIDFNPQKKLNTKATK